MNSAISVAELAQKDNGPDFHHIEVTVGERSYVISTEDGIPFRVESVFAGYLGRITYREVKRGGSAWNRALDAAGLPR